MSSPNYKEIGKAMKMMMYGFIVFILFALGGMFLFCILLTMEVYGK